MAKQVIHGHAFEYAIALALGKALSCQINNNSAFDIATNSYQHMNATLRQRADKSASDVAGFLIKNDKRLNTATTIALQDAHTGTKGDVRDIIITNSAGDEIGISAKHRHYAIKHPRLSGSIDFGLEWGGCAVSDAYWQAVRPIFADLAHRKSKGEDFKDIPNKQATIYLPVLSAFEDELKQLCATHGQKFIKEFFHYLVGRHDFYKVICDDKESVVESMNINGSLVWGARWGIPQRIQVINRVPNSQSTLMVTFDGGWQIKFRLHSARTQVEPSLKFDVTFIGISSKVSRVSLPI